MERYLLDTHVFLWLIQDDPQLSDRAREVIANNESQLNFSVVSIWEIVIKLNIGKLKIGHTIEDIYTLLARVEIAILPIESSDLERYLSLPLYHREPFDRLIISQAIPFELVSFETGVKWIGRH